MTWFDGCNMCDITPDFKLGKCGTRKCSKKHKKTAGNCVAFVDDDEEDEPEEVEEEVIDVKITPVKKKYDT